MKAEDKLVLSFPVLVEGKYDKIKLAGIVASPILTADGFSVFRNAEKLAYLRAICRDGVIVLTDSDSAGFFLRSRLRGLLPGIRTYDVYIPKVEGKERRKSAPSKENLIGVEGIDDGVLRDILVRFASAERGSLTPVTAAEMYELGLSGRDNSADARKKLCVALGLPETLGCKALTEYINMYVGKEKLLETLNTAL